ncbi:MAG TPA: THUMP domain-containing protein [Patescibacteria group bacterium]|nr:THUMP domain-containing protein [Patescibacteria group bacterium]
MGSAFVVTTSSGFEGEARREILKLLPSSDVRKLFFKGNLYVESNLPEEEALEALRKADTTYMGRAFPVDANVKISAVKASIEAIYDVVSGIGNLREGDTFRVSCTRRGSHEFRSRDVEVAVGMRLEEETDAVVDLQSPSKTVVVQIFQDFAYVGVTPSVNLLVKEIKRFRKYAKGERPFTRAEFKIREALKAFDVEVTSDFRVLDVGAAPGGWTKVLAGMARSVVAVDPADLHLSVEEISNVTHLRCRAEDLPEDIGEFDLITNDMNISPTESAEIMNTLAELLREGGAAIMTVKFVTRERRRHTREAIGILEEAYTDFKVRRLPHNRNETSVYMHKKS